MEFSTVILHMQQQLEHYHTQNTSESHHTLDPHHLIELINLIRPKQVDNVQELEKTLEKLIQTLHENPSAQNTLQQFILGILQQYKQSQVYSDMGIFSLDGFLSQLSQRISIKFLPNIPDQTQLNYLVEQLFYLPTDHQWLEKISDHYWIKLLNTMNINDSFDHDYTKKEILHALTVLSYRISGLSLHPEFLNALPELLERESPFLIQNQEIMEFIECYKKTFLDQDITVLQPADPSQAIVMLEQCHELVLKARRATKRIGVSFSLTYLLTLLDQCLERSSILLDLLTQEQPKRYVSLGHFICSLSLAHHQAKSVRALLTTNSELIALQVTENASRTGERYVSSDRKGLFEMYRRAAGAGMIIATMATLKTLAGRLVLAPFMQAFLYSMNYALGFVLIHVVHFTVATKQPAATAAALAASIQKRKGSKTAQLAELCALIINIIRTQLWAILGNISIAIPVAALISLSWEYFLLEPLMTHNKAAKTLHDLNPFTSLAVPHAAIAGVCLFLSGLIAGYFDNLAIYHKVGTRLKAHVYLAQRLGQERLNRFSDYIDQNFGAIMGNFIFGCMLGSMGTIGLILGLPLDIRHIAFASANFIQGLMNINGSPDIGLIIVSFLGVLLIGLTNLFVSFTLTIIVALRARQVRFEQWKPLAKLVLTHFVTRPSDFFWINNSPSTHETHLKK